MTILLDKRQLRALRNIGITIHAPLDDDEHRIPEAPFPLERFSSHSPSGVMPLGAYSYAHSYCKGVARIGRYCSIGAGLSVISNTHPLERLSTSPVFYARRRFRQWGGGAEDLEQLVPFENEMETITIGHDVWIGDDVSIRRGVNIGNGAVIAKGALVTRDIPDYAIVGGNPAKTIRSRFEKSLVAELLELEWWQYPVEQLVYLSPASPRDFIRDFKAARKLGKLRALPEERKLLRQFLSTLAGE